MAALSAAPRVTVRPAREGEGTAVAALWRELWDAHEAWGGYEGSRDARVYSQLARRIEDDVRVRAGQPVLGRHVHIVADLAGSPCGQVEGWFERHGVEAATPYTCEVRSLIVTGRARGMGAGRALLDDLGKIARDLSRGAPCVLAAEVLEPNPARGFYEQVGYRAVAHNARIDASHAWGARPAAGGARVASPRDALGVACLEGTLAARRRAAGDIRFDRPKAVDATLVGAIAAHLATEGAGPVTLVALDDAGVVRAAATFAEHMLEPPFVPVRRALLGRVALDPTVPASAHVAALVGLACRLALARGAQSVEICDLTAPGTELHDAVLAAGARPWSRIVLRPA